MPIPKILIATPTFDGKIYCLDRWIEAVRNIGYASFDILMVDNSSGMGYYNLIKGSGIPVMRSVRLPRARETIAVSRNIIRDKVLNEGYDYLFSLEQDVIPQPDILKRLLSHNLPIVGGVYCNLKKDNFGKAQAMPLVYMRVSDEEFEILKNDERFRGTAIQEKILSGAIKGPEDMNSQLSIEQVKEPQLLEVFFTGLGCLLIHRSVLEKVKFNWAEDSFDDAVFAKDAQKQGFKVFVDTSVNCAHIQYDTSWSGIEY